MMNSNLGQLTRLSAIALAALASSAHAVVQPDLPITSSTPNVVVGGVAELLLRFHVDVPVSLETLTIQLNWVADALEFLPASSMAMGVGWDDLVANVGNDGITSSADAYTIDGFLSPKIDLNDSTAEVRLSFLGKQVGFQQVSYVLSFSGSTTIDTFVESTGAGFASINVSPIPEPTPTALLLGGLAMLGWLAKRRSA